MLFILIFIIIINAGYPAFSQGDFSLPSGLSKSELNNAIEDYVVEHKDTTAAVAISVFNNKEDIYLGYHGYKDLENEITITEDTVFEWGSISKLFIWVSLYQLLEQGKIDLNEDIRTYLPEGFLKKINKTEKITMLNLMHHDAGWQDLIVDNFVRDMGDVLDLKQALQKLEPEQIYPVGKYTAYSNWGSALAAYIVEEITGQKYSDYVIDNIFKPLNMNHTAILPDLSDNSWVQERRKEVKGYTTENVIIPNDFVHIPLYPVGMVTGTLEDLEKFGKNLIQYDGQQNLFKNDETLNKLFQPTLTYGDTGYARNSNGFWFIELGVPVLGHGGNTIAFSSNLLLDPLSKTCAIILTNQGYEEIYTSEIMPLIFGDFNPESSLVKETEVEDLVGTYQQTRTVTKGYGKLYSLLSRITVKDDNEELTIGWPGNSFSAIEFQPSLYNVEGSLFQIFEDKDDSIIMSTAYGDFNKLEPSQVIMDFTIIGFALVSILYAIIMLIMEFINYLRFGRKDIYRIKSSLNKYHIFTLFQILFLVINILIMVIKLLNFTMLENIKPHVYLSSLFMITLLGSSIYLVLNLSKTDITRKKKAKYIITSLASIIISFNIYYWELFLLK